MFPPIVAYIAKWPCKSFFWLHTIVFVKCFLTHLKWLQILSSFSQTHKDVCKGQATPVRENIIFKCHVNKLCFTGHVRGRFQIALQEAMDPS
jgi:hypothetical protein